MYIIIVFILYSLYLHYVFITIAKDNIFTVFFMIIVIFGFLYLNEGFLLVILWFETTIFFII